MHKLLEKLFTKNPPKSFLETHKYRIKIHETCYFIEIKGKKYRSWTHIGKVLNDVGLSNIYKGEEIEWCIHHSRGEDAALAHLKRFCDLIIDWERDRVDSTTLTGDLSDFYIIENL